MTLDQKQVAAIAEKAKEDAGTHSTNTPSVPQQASLQQKQATQHSGDSGQSLISEHLGHIGASDTSGVNHEHELIKTTFLYVNRGKDKKLSNEQKADRIVGKMTRGGVFLGYGEEGNAEKIKANKERLHKLVMKYITTQSF